MATSNSRCRRSAIPVLRISQQGRGILRLMASHNLVKVEVQGRFSERGIPLTVTNKQIGYELRCADPIAFDAAYCRDLGHGAVRFLAEGGTGAMVSIQDGRLVPIRFEDMRTATGRTRVRNVDVGSDGYRVAREYMLRLEPEDFRDAAWVERLAEAANLSSDRLRARFERPTA